MDRHKELEQLNQEIERLKGESLRYLRRNVRDKKKLQEALAHIQELFDRLKSLLEGKPSEFEAEVRKRADSLRITPGVKARGIGLTRIEGIGVSTAQKLIESGVTSMQKLLDLGASPRGRRQLAEDIGTSERLILTWVSSADLMRIKGIGEEYTDLLGEAGVDTVPELAQRNPANLYQKLVEVNESKKLVRRLPSEAEVETWVTQAKELPRVIRY